ncbi:hypothetical protein RKD19_000005 [Streptomyces canus]
MRAATFIARSCSREGDISGVHVSVRPSCSRSRLMSQAADSVASTVGSTRVTVRPLTAYQEAATRTRTLLPVPVGALRMSIGPAASRINSCAGTASVVCNCAKRFARTVCTYRSAAG